MGTKSKGAASGTEKSREKRQRSLGLSPSKTRTRGLAVRVCTWEARSGESTHGTRIGCLFICSGHGCVGQTAGARAGKDQSPDGKTAEDRPGALVARTILSTGTITGTANIY